MNIDKLASAFLALADGKDESSKSLPRLPEDNPTMKSLETHPPSNRPPTMPYTGGEERMTAAELAGVPPQRHEHLYVEIRDLRQLISMLLQDPDAKHYTIEQLKHAVDSALYG